MKEFSYCISCIYVCVCVCVRVCVYAHLPFLMVFRPTSGSNTGSILSSIFSISTQSPSATARSILSRYLNKENQIAKMIKLVNFR